MPTSRCSGLASGRDGAPHRYTLYSEGEPPRPIKTKEVGLTIRPDDVLVLESGGGGGWGDPALRDPDAIASDIVNGFVTDEIANGAVAISPPPRAGEGVPDKGA